MIRISSQNSWPLLLRLLYKLELFLIPENELMHEAGRAVLHVWLCVCSKEPVTPGHSDVWMGWCQSPVHCSLSWGKTQCQNLAQMWNKSLSNWFSGLEPLEGNISERTSSQVHRMKAWHAVFCRSGFFFLHLTDFICTFLIRKSFGGRRASFSTLTHIFSSLPTAYLHDCCHLQLCRP